MCKQNKIKVCIEPLDESRKWILTETLMVFSKVVHDWIEVPKGFITDGCSIPTVFSPVFKHGGRKFAPGVIHDYLYATGLYSKKISDAVFEEMMDINGVKDTKSYIFHKCVSFFAGGVWKRYRKDVNKVNGLIVVPKGFIADGSVTEKVLLK